MTDVSSALLSPACLRFSLLGCCCLSSPTCRLHPSPRPELILTEQTQFPSPYLFNPRHISSLWCSPGICSNSHLMSRWYHPNISSSAAEFTFCPQSFSASGSFSVSPLFASCGQSIGGLALVSVLPMIIQSWFPLGWTGLSSLQSKKFWRVFSSTTIQKYQFFEAQPSLWSSSHIYTWLLEKP